MSYIIVPHAQGTAGWHDARKACHGTASELSAAAGKSKYQSREDLLKTRFTGLTEEINANTQALFDKGHLAEAMARVIAESIVEDEFYPTTATLEVGGLKLLASFDGINLNDDTIFEHKLWNAKLADDVREGRLSEHYTLQLDQQLLISGAEKALFMCSDGTEDNMVYCYYFADPVKINNVVKIWQQFHADLSSYTLPVETVTATAEAVMDLPAVIVQVRGELTLCNIADMRPVFDKFLAEATINLVTDNDFAQAEEESKAARKAAKSCLATAKGVIDQTASISEVARELEQYATKFNALALSQEKAVKTQKEARKLAIMNIAKGAWLDHLNSLEAEIKPIRLITGQPDFPDAMKNKRLLSAVQNSVNCELARVKILADTVASALRVNLNLMTEYAAYQFLFNDLDLIIYKSFDDLKLLAVSRIADHDKREAEKLEAQRVQMEAEAKRKAEAEQAAKLEAERAKIRVEEQAKIAEERRLEQIRVNAQAKADKDTYNFEMAAQHEANRQELKQKIQEAAQVKPEPPKEPPTQSAPNRTQLIDAIANLFGVTRAVAEQWLVEEFEF